MKVKDIVKKLDLSVINEGDLDIEVTGAYASDLLSDVMAQTVEGNLWITIMVHENILAVASLNEMAGIIVANGKKPTDETIAKAKEQNLTLMTTSRNTYNICGALYKLGVKGVE